MNIVETVKAVCRERHIPISKLEKDCGFANGYISQLRKGTMPYERMVRVSDYLGLSLGDLGADGDFTEQDEKAGKLPVLGIVRAGKTQAEYTDIIDYIKSDYRKEDGYFGLMVKGDSMQPRIYEGDIVIVRAQPDAENGEIVVAQINGDEACVKKLIKFAHGIALQSLNPAYPLLQFSEEQMHEIPVIILGKVVEARARF